MGDEEFRREFENRRPSHPLTWFEMGSWLPVVVTEKEGAVLLVGEVRAEPTASFDLLGITVAGDTLLRRTIEYDPLEITRDERERMKDHYVDQFAGSGFARPTTSGRPARVRAAARRALTFPAAYPPVRQIVAGSDGSIWLLRESSPRPSDLWEVYSEEGSLEFSVRMDSGRAGAEPWAPRLRIFHASRDEVWGITADTLDVPYIQRFRVTKTCK